jgi:O-Antigen ligase
VVYAATYITGAEVLWRMTGSYSFWEGGKYAVAAVFIVAMIRHRRLKPAISPVLYFALLVPSALLTLWTLPGGGWRDAFSTNLSGPFSLMIAGCFFSQVTLSRQQLHKAFLMLIGPIIGIGAVALFEIVTAEKISFGRSSSLVTSGGFGPNQVSSILGLGALISFLLLVDRKANLKLRIVSGLLIVFFSAQSALTFSRGGLYNAAGAILLASLFLLKDPRTRFQFLMVAVLLVGTAYFLVLPRLDAFTGGALTARFEATTTTGREQLAQMDMDIFYDNPILGVGPGLAPWYHAGMGFKAMAHTEFTRLLAEHGIFGLAALLVFLTALAGNVLKQRSYEHRAFMAALSGWTLVYMLNAGMRVVAPSLMFGLTFCCLRQTTKAIDITRIRQQSRKRNIPLRRLASRKTLAGEH